MSLSLKCLIAAGLLTAAPATAFAQTWPAVVASGVQALSPQTRLLALSAAPSAEPRAAYRFTNDRRGAPLKLERPNRLTQPDASPEVEIPAKADWSDDQGLRVTPTRVAFKRRF